MGLRTAACSATSRKVSVHLINSTFFLLSDYIVSGVKKSFWEPSECKMHLIHCRQHTNYMTITKYSLSHHTLLTEGGRVPTQSFHSSVATLNCHSPMHSSNMCLPSLRPHLSCSGLKCNANMHVQRQAWLTLLAILFMAHRSWPVLFRIG